jgi:hypothetical protein
VTDGVLQGGFKTSKARRLEDLISEFKGDADPLSRREALEFPVVVLIRDAEAELNGESQRPG